MPENAIIMAGGQGVRLRPLTEERPKPLVPLLDEPVVGYTLHLLRRHGYRHVTMALGYRAAQVREALGDGHRWGVTLRYVEETAPLGTAGSVLAASRGMVGTVLVMSGDGLTDCDLTALYHQHIAGGCEASMVLKRVPHGGDYGVCHVDDVGHITAFTEKPGTASIDPELVNTGLYFLERSAIDRIPEGVPYDFGRELFPRMLAQGVVLHGIPTDAYWCDVGTREAYAQAQTDLLMGRVGLPVRGKRRGSVILGEHSRLAEGVRITGRCYVGHDAQIGQGTVLGPGTVISHGARVGCGVRLENACLWENVRIDGGAILKNVMVLPRPEHQGVQRFLSYGAK